MTNLYIKKLTPRAELPTRTTPDSAGLFLQQPGDRAMIPTGLKMSVDSGYCIKFYPRSGMSLKHGLSLINCVGIGDQ